MSDFQPIELSITLNKASWRRVTAFSYYPVLLEPELAGAMLESMELLQMSAYKDMWSTFMNPEGPLEDSLGYEVVTPYEAWMGTDSFYGRRRDLGFGGMTDVLGRFYPRDDGIFWAERAAIANDGKIKTIFNKALIRVAYRLELGYP